MRAHKSLAAERLHEFLNAVSDRLTLAGIHVDELRRCQCLTDAVDKRFSRGE